MYQKSNVFQTLLRLAVPVMVFLSSCSQQEGVKIEGGLVKGVIENGITVYKGIPFAAPPIGDLRWKAPQPVIPWDSVLVADEFGPACPQMSFRGGNDENQYSEDCLYLNVWTPATSSNEKLPVMVWIYGGGFAMGSTSIPTYFGDSLAKKGVVVVSVAYRVGALGFMAHPELSAENPQGVSGNYGMLDQIAGLKWVQNNIAAFGGDPGNVTVFGESAGAISVSILCGSPLAKGLFQRAISESGGSFWPVLDQHTDGISSLKGAEKTGIEFAERMGATSIADLRALSPEKFLNDPTANMGGFWPNCDGYVIADDQYKLYSKGIYNDVDVIIGTNSDEGAMFVNGTTAEQLKASLTSRFGPLADKALEVYPATNDSVAQQSARNIFRETAFAWPSWIWAKLQKETGNSSVYVYYFDQQQPPTPFGFTVGATHASEIPYVFGKLNLNANSPYTNTDNKLSSIMMDYWVNFVKTGNPNGEGLPKWPKFDDGNNSVMYLKGAEPYSGPVPNKPQLEFMEEYFTWLRELE